MVNDDILWEVMDIAGNFVYVVAQSEQEAIILGLEAFSRADEERVFFGSEMMAEQIASVRDLRAGWTGEPYFG